MCYSCFFLSYPLCIPLSRFLLNFTTKQIIFTKEFTCQSAEQTFSGSWRRGPQKYILRLSNKSALLCQDQLQQTLRRHFVRKHCCTNCPRKGNGSCVKSMYRQNTSRACIDRTRLAVSASPTTFISMRLFHIREKHGMMYNRPNCNFYQGGPCQAAMCSRKKIVCNWARADVREELMFLLLLSRFYLFLSGPLNP